MRRAAKVDENQGEIKMALLAAGASVVSLAAVGEGVPDLLAGYDGVNILLEIKTDKGKLTPAQVEWHADWRGQVCIVRTPEEALAVLAALERQKGQ